MLIALALLPVHTRGRQTPRVAPALALVCALDPHSTDCRGGTLLLAHHPLRDNPDALRLDGDSKEIRRARTQRAQRMVEEVLKKRTGRLLRSFEVV